MAIQNKIGKFLLSLIEPTTKYVKQEVRDVFGEQRKIEQMKRAGVSKKELLKESFDISKLPLIRTLSKQQGRKAIANIASFLTPFGRGGSLASRALIPGAVSGGLFSASQEGATPTSVAGGATLGAGVAGAGTLLGNLLGKAKTSLGNKGASAFLRSTGSKFRDAIESHGIDLNAIVKKYVPKGSNYDDIVGVASERGRGGVLGKALTAAEKNIDDVIRSAGSTVKIAGDDVLNALKSERRLLSGKIGGESKRKALDKIIKETEKKYVNGVTVRKAVETLRTANKQFGKSIVSTEKGAVASSAQKVEANALKSVLKKLFPEIKDALRTQEEIFTLRPILNQAKGKVQAGKFNLSKIDLTKPGSLIDPILNSPRVASTLAGAKQGGGIEGIMKLLSSSKALQAEVPMLVSALGGQPSAEGVQPAQPTQQGLPKQGDLSPEGQWMWDDASKDWVANEQAQAGGQDTDTIKQALQIAMLQDLQTGGKNISELNTILTAISATEEDEGTQTEREKSSLAKSGVRNLDKVASIIASDPSILTKQLIPGKFASREFDAAMYDAIDSLLKLRTGATSNEQEIRGYMGSIAPKFGDSPTVAKAKIEQIRQDFASYIK